MPTLETVEYVDTFRKLKLKHDQEKDRQESKPEMTTAYVFILSLSLSLSLFHPLHNYYSLFSHSHTVHVYTYIVTVNLGSSMLTLTPVVDSDVTLGSWMRTRRHGLTMKRKRRVVSHRQSPPRSSTRSLWAHQRTHVPHRASPFKSSPLCHLQVRRSLAFPPQRHHCF